MRSILKYRLTVDRANDELQYKRWTAQGLTPNNWKLNVCSCFNVNINKFLVVSDFNCITVTCRYKPCFNQSSPLLYFECNDLPFYSKSTK